MAVFLCVYVYIWVVWMAVCVCACRGLRVGESLKYRFVRLSVCVYGWFECLCVCAWVGSDVSLCVRAYVCSKHLPTYPKPSSSTPPLPLELILPPPPQFISIHKTSPSPPPPTHTP